MIDFTSDKSIDQNRMGICFYLNTKNGSFSCDVSGDNPTRGSALKELANNLPFTIQHSNGVLRVDDSNFISYNWSAFNPQR